MVVKYTMVVISQSLGWEPFKSKTLDNKFKGLLWWSHHKFKLKQNWSGAGIVNFNFGIYTI